MSLAGDHGERAEQVIKDRAETESRRALPLDVRLERPGRAKGLYFGKLYSMEGTARGCMERVARECTEVAVKACMAGWEEAPNSFAGRRPSS